jgi:hypothetical protein
MAHGRPKTCWRRAKQVRGTVFQRLPSWPSLAGAAVTQEEPGAVSLEQRKRSQRLD